jgi:hypothetical protein
MATTTTATTAATTTVHPGTPPADPTLAPATSNSRSQRITHNLHHTMCRNPPTPGGSGGPSGPGRPGGPGGPEGPGAPQGPPAAVPAAAPAGGNANDRVMGNLPQIFDGDRKNARNFLDAILGYFWANSRVLGLNSPIRKVSIALTLIQGPQVATWVRDMGAWINSLNPVEDNIQFTWDTFVQEFTEHFTDSQEQQRA